MSKNSNLNLASKNKNNEFYTQYEDIELECLNYKEQLKGKTIYMPCDNPKYSKFWQYFTANFEYLGLKEIIATYCTNDLLNSNKIVFDGTNTFIQPLKGNGDFRSNECNNILKECDIVITNPPFSLFREFINWILKENKEFLLIANKNAITYKHFFALLKENKVRLGYNNVKVFITPNGETKKFGNIGWFTTLIVDYHKKSLVLTEKYSADKYPHYDNYDAINVDKLSDIPYDYNGIIGVPITIFEHLNPNQFEILGICAGRDEFGIKPTIKYVNAVQHNVDGSISNGSKLNTHATIITEDTSKIYYTADNSPYRLKSMYARILIRRK